MKHLKKIVNGLFITSFSLFAVILVGYFYQEFAANYVNNEMPLGGDYYMHLANISHFNKNFRFPIMSWQSTWYAGYPVVEGYPWLHNYLVQPLAFHLGNPAVAMKYYSAALLFFYFVLSYFLLSLSARNVAYGLFASLLLLYGADATQILYVGGFIVFASSQFLLPLTLIWIILARERNSWKLRILALITLTVSFYAHSSITTILIIPAITPFLLFDERGNLNISTIITTARFYLLFALLAGLGIYQTIDQSLNGIKINSPGIVPPDQWGERLSFMLSWPNPLIFVVAVITILIYVLRYRNIGIKARPHIFSFLFVFAAFLLMFFQITGLVIILLAERAIWALSLTILVFTGAVIREIGKGRVARITKLVIFSTLALLYAVSIHILRPQALMPSTLKEVYPVAGTGTAIQDISTYQPTSWNQNYSNYRSDGLDYIVYQWWNLISPNPTFKGFFPALRSPSLDWSGLVTASEIGLLGEAGTPDVSNYAVNQSKFFLDWYAIKYLQTSTVDNAGLPTHLKIADYLLDEPFLKNEEITQDLKYLEFNDDYIGPIMAPTNAKTIALVGGDKQYDNFIRLLAYTGYNSQQIIPLYLGKNLRAINRDNINLFDAVVLYGYGGFFSGNVWDTLYIYVKNGGNLIIETGQKVAQSGSPNLPLVFPIKGSSLEDVIEPWVAGIEEAQITVGIDKQFFQPLSYNYLPFSISRARKDNLREWAVPHITKGDYTLLVSGSLDRGKVVWSGLNLPFQAVDTRNLGQVEIFNNIVDWFFPDLNELKPVGEFEYHRSSPEKISVIGGPAKGILIKEHFDSGWSARINDRGSKIFKAGLSMMYVQADQEGDNSLQMVYNGSLTNWLLISISIFVLVLLVIYTLANINICAIISEKLFSRRTKNDKQNY